MLENFAIDGFAALLLLLVGWYWWFRRSNRRRSVQILRWIEGSFSGTGSVCGLRWHSASRFRVELRLATSVFRRASLAVQLEPRESPLGWLISRIRKRKETLTFEAELDHRPARNLHLVKRYWSWRTRRLKPRSTRQWKLVSFTPYLVSPQPLCRHDQAHMEIPQTFVHSCDFFHVAFRKRSPHFVVTAPLESLGPGAKESGMFDRLHELASIASASTY